MRIRRLALLLMLVGVATAPGCNTAGAAAGAIAYDATVEKARENERREQAAQGWEPHHQPVPDR